MCRTVHKIKTSDFTCSFFARRIPPRCQALRTVLQLRRSVYIYILEDLLLAFADHLFSGLKMRENNERAYLP